jgi:ABC-type transport system involved in multi-copper enzyme maturation permease subunit
MQQPNWSRIVAMVAVITGSIGFLYSALALLLVASLSGAPNYPTGRAEFNQRIWLLGLGLFLVLALSGFFVLRRVEQSGKSS